MSHFVGGDSDGGHRVAGVHIMAEPDHFVRRIIVVRKLASYHFDGDIAKTLGIQNAPGRFGPPSSAQEPGSWF